MTGNTPPVEPAPSKPWYQRWWVWAIAALVVPVAIAGSISGSEDAEGTAADTTTTTAVEETTTTTTQPPATTTTEYELTDETLELL